MSKIKIIISGGGTGGHVYPAISIANELKKQRPDAEILFVGAEGKLEMEKVPKAGYPIEGLRISGFHRRLTLWNIFRNLSFPFKLVISLLRARSIVRRFQPDVAVGVGGYASGPTLQVAAKSGVPTLIQEQNSYPGVTNKLLAGKVNRICVAYEGLEIFFPKEKITMTGNPVRQDLFDLEKKKQEGLRYFDLSSDKKTIFLMGGSLGARTLNDAMAANSQLISENPQIQILWQCGKLYVEEFQNSATAKLPNVKIQPFVDRMDLAYAAADLMITRAGASTISELCIIGKPAILVPSPNVAEDHQTMNARALSDKTAAVLVKDKEAEKMLERALHIFENEQFMDELKLNIKKMAKPKAAENIVKEILSLVE